MISSFELKLKKSLERIAKAISLHEHNKAAPLSIQVLIQVEKELEEMVRVMDPKIYMPGYPRFILDWPEKDGLIDELINLVYQYGKIRKK